MELADFLFYRPNLTLKLEVRGSSPNAVGLSGKIIGGPICARDAPCNAHITRIDCESECLHISLIHIPIPGAAVIFRTLPMLSLALHVVPGDTTKRTTATYLKGTVKVKSKEHQEVKYESTVQKNRGISERVHPGKPATATRVSFSSRVFACPPAPSLTKRTKKINNKALLYSCSRHPRRARYVNSKLSYTWCLFRAGWISLRTDQWWGDNLFTRSLCPICTGVTRLTLLWEEIS